MVTISNLEEAIEYLNKVVRPKLEKTTPGLGDVVIKDKWGLGHHSDRSKIVRAFEYTFEGLPEIGSDKDSHHDKKRRYLLSTGETLEASYSEIKAKILKDNPDFDDSTEEGRKLISDFLNNPREWRD